MGTFSKLLNPGFLFTALAVGVGGLAGIVLPNSLLRGFAWYTGWTRRAIQAGVAVLVTPMLTGMLLPAALAASFNAGAIGIVALAIVGDLWGKTFTIGPGDSAMTTQSLFAGYDRSRLRGYDRLPLMGEGALAGARASGFGGPRAT